MSRSNDNWIAFLEIANLERVHLNADDVKRRGGDSTPTMRELMENGESQEIDPADRA